MREIIFDTETTGLDKNEDRIIEIGCIELQEGIATGKFFHKYINPQGKLVSAGAFAIHNISNEKLLHEPIFSEIVDDFLEFIGDSTLIAHNAFFDLGFMNAEFLRLGKTPISEERIIDTLALARRQFPTGANNLNALCKRFGIDTSRRTFHGALLDAEILAEVYIELTGGRQKNLGFGNLAHDKGHSDMHPVTASSHNPQEQSMSIPALFKKNTSFERLTNEEVKAHRELLDKIGKQALWFQNKESRKG